MYDVYEKLPDGKIQCVGCARTFEEVESQVHRLAQNSPNEFYAEHLLTGLVVTRARRRSRAKSIARFWSAITG
jgi:hypothetical protein